MDLLVLLDHLEEAVNGQDFAEASGDLAAIEKKYGDTAYRADSRYAILRAECLYQNGCGSDAEHAIKSGLDAFPDNYELYFIRAEYAAGNNDIERAAASYHAALFWGLNSKDQEFLAGKMLSYKKNNTLNQHCMNLALAELVRERMELGHYEEGLDFLKWLFFVLPAKDRLYYASEETMLQFIMLEVTITEKAVFDEEKFRYHNTCKQYNNDHRLFLDAYQEIKHAIRRIWFCLSQEDQRYLLEVIGKYDVSAALLAVITKYSIPEENWVEAFNRIDAFLHENSTDLEKEFVGFVRAIGNMTGINQKETKRVTQAKNKHEFKRIYLSNPSEYPDQKQLDEQTKDPYTIAVIFCTNNERMERECLLYLSYLTIPEGMTLKVYAIWNAKGICQGYNRAMAQINAKYKIYIHHDCFLICPDALIRVIDIFRGGGGWKMLGVAGATTMTDNYCWGENDIANVRYNLYQDSCMATILSKTIRYDSKVEDAVAIDGVMLATCEDIVWREDVFDEWHFYDISQSFEFKVRGYRIGVINDDEPWMLHETTTKTDPDGRYDHYGRVFEKLYWDQDASNTRND